MQITYQWMGFGMGFVLVTSLAIAASRPLSASAQPAKSMGFESQGEKGLHPLPQLAGTALDQDTSTTELAHRLISRGDLEAAIAAFKRAKYLSAYDRMAFIYAHVSLGDTWKRKGNLSKAAAAYRQALAIDRNNSNIQAKLANVEALLKFQRPRLIHVTDIF
jgi:tetratricopeptide (TPR) repeat protein